MPPAVTPSANSKRNQKPDLAKFVASELSKVRVTYEVSDELYRLYRTIYFAQLAASKQGCGEPGPIEWVPISDQ
jgi:hypothetical protein